MSTKKKILIFTSITLALIVLSIPPIVCFSIYHNSYDPRGRYGDYHSGEWPYQYSDRVEFERFSKIFAPGINAAYPENDAVKTGLGKYEATFVVKNAFNQDTVKHKIFFYRNKIHVDDNQEIADTLTNQSLFATHNEKLVVDNWAKLKGESTSAETVCWFRFQSPCRVETYFDIQTAYLENGYRVLWAPVDSGVKDEICIGIPFIEDKVLYELLTNSDVDRFPDSQWSQLTIGSIQYWQQAVKFPTDMNQLVRSIMESGIYGNLSNTDFTGRFNYIVIHGNLGEEIVLGIAFQGTVEDMLPLMVDEDLELVKYILV